jgi:uncharacterized BrkB/YihY/UPF0761 family membrane protein
MADESVFRGIIDFFVRLGVYDVILPFVLVFSIVFAILEKSKIFGTETIEGEQYTKKNINAMTAFVIGFLVVASGQLVSIINKSLGNIVILLMVIISFLILIGSFFREDEHVFLKEGPWRTGFMIASLIGVILIFLNAIPTEDGSNWLNKSAGWISDHWNTNWVGSIILIILIVVLMYYIVRDRPKPKKDGGE